MFEYACTSRKLNGKILKICILYFYPSNAFKIQFRCKMKDLLKASVEEFLFAHIFFFFCFLQGLLGLYWYFSLLRCFQLVLTRFGMTVLTNFSLLLWFLMSIKFSLLPFGQRLRKEAKQCFFDTLSEQIFQYSLKLQALCRCFYV